MSKPVGSVSFAKRSATGSAATMHEEPQIPNFGRRNSGEKIKPGMTLAIEPMVNLGGYEVRTLSDGWTIVTTDGQPSADFEHTGAHHSIQAPDPHDPARPEFSRLTLSKPEPFNLNPSNYASSPRR